MKRLPLIAGLSILVLVLGVAWFWRSRQGGLEANAIDLIALFPDAEKRTTMPSLEAGYAIETVVIDGERRRSIFAHPFSRIYWTLTIPPAAVLRTDAGVRPDSWEHEGDGCLFRIGVNDGSDYTEFFKLAVMPHDNPTDRRWFPVEIDLGPYAGREVRVTFNTEPGPAGNAVADACVWGSPRIVPRGDI